MRSLIVILFLSIAFKINAQKIEKNLLLDNWKVVSINGMNATKKMNFVFQITDSTLVFADEELKYSLEDNIIFYKTQIYHQVWKIVKLKKDKLIIKDFVNEFRFKCVRTEEDVIDQ